jgi:hypothetical protein
VIDQVAMRKQLRHVAQSRLCLLSAHRTPEEADLMHYGTLKLILMEQVRSPSWSRSRPLMRQVTPPSWSRSETPEPTRHSQSY